jgi:hypothetical protein
MISIYQITVKSETSCYNFYLTVGEPLAIIILWFDDISKPKALQNTYKKTMSPKAMRSMKC